MKTFVNFTNHPSNKWDEKQIVAAEMYGNIVDVPFPAVDPHLDEEGIKELSKTCVDTILEQDPECVMAQGEFTLCYQVVQMLLAQGIKVVAACSVRNTVETGNSKISVFEFIQFRRYE